VSRIKSPGSDPLEVWKKECIARNLCDEDGGRLPGSHWTVCIAIAAETPSKVRTDDLDLVLSFLVASQSLSDQKVVLFVPSFRPRAFAPLGSSASVVPELISS
jgi:hypothetical protein